VNESSNLHRYIRLQFRPFDCIDLYAQNDNVVFYYYETAPYPYSIPFYSILFHSIFHSIPVHWTQSIRIFSLYVLVPYCSSQWFLLAYHGQHGTSMILLPSVEHSSIQLQLTTLLAYTMPMSLSFTIRSSLMTSRWRFSRWILTQLANFASSFLVTLVVPVSS